MNKKKNVLVAALSPVAESLNEYMRIGGLSGGDRILIEILKYWQTLFNIEALVWSGSRFLLGKYSVDKIHYHELPLKISEKLGFFFLYMAKIIFGSLKALTGKFEYPDIIYTVSDFYPDIIPSIILKIRYPNAKWICSLYLFCPSPFSKESPYRGIRRIGGLVYFLSQIISKYIIKWFADVILVTSDPDVKYFLTEKRKKDNIVVVRGGVDVKTPLTVADREKIYDGVFIGRFHPQKGVMELMDIWAKVLEKKKDARLAIIGLGELEKEMRLKAEKLGIMGSLHFFGFQDGVEKLKIFKSSKVILHPAIYDSGGMAACEAFACGLPGVSFDLEALKTYYAKGMIKTKCFDMDEFAGNILHLLTNDKFYKDLSIEALQYAREKWDWEKRVIDLTEEILNGLKFN